MKLLKICEDKNESGPLSVAQHFLKQSEAMFSRKVSDVCTNRANIFQHPICLQPIQVNFTSNLEFPETKDKKSTKTNYELSFGGDLPSCLHDRQLCSVEPHPQKQKTTSVAQEMLGTLLHPFVYQNKLKNKCIQMHVNARLFSVVNCTCSNVS